MTKRLTSRTLESLRAPVTGRLELTDADVPGLKFRMTPTGHASWSVQVRVGGEKRRFTLGTYPDVKLSEARLQARELRMEQDRDVTRSAKGVRPGARPRSSARAV